jgi:hypothetical protein
VNTPSLPFFPERAQWLNALLRRIAGDPGGVHRADRNVGHTIGTQVRLRQRLIDAGLIGARRASTLDRVLKNKNTFYAISVVFGISRISTSMAQAPGTIEISQYCTSQQIASDITTCAQSAINAASPPVFIARQPRGHPVSLDPRFLARNETLLGAERDDPMRRLS